MTWAYIANGQWNVQIATVLIKCEPISQQHCCRKKKHHQKLKEKIHYDPHQKRKYIVRQSIPAYGVTKNDDRTELMLCLIGSDEVILKLIIT